MRLRRKLTIAFFLVSSLVSVLLALFLYRFIEGQLTAELKDRVKDITYIGAHSVDLARYKRLTAKLGELNENAVAQVEHSDDYKEIFGQLQMMRKAESSIIHFVYILAPTEDPENPRFVVDADVLDYEKRLGRGEKLGKNDRIALRDLPARALLQVLHARARRLATRERAGHARRQPRAECARAVGAIPAAPSETMRSCDASPAGADRIRSARIQQRANG